MADYRAFLAPVEGPGEPIVLPYFGGTRIDAADRRFHVDRPPQRAGWWRWKISGRRAAPIEPAAQPDLAALPALRGHWADGWIVGAQLARVALPPDDEPPPLSRVTARRWHSGDVMLDAVDFEDDAEVTARQRLADRAALGGDVKGVVPSLRVAFGLALGRVLAGELGSDASVRELAPRAVAIADGGRDAVAAWLADLAATRAREEAEARRRAELRKLETAAGSARAVRRDHDTLRAVDDALDHARARMLGVVRRDQGRQLDVTWEVDGQQVITLVDAATLQVLDPGVCLGHGDEYRGLTLDAMPSVVREAIDGDRLVILRRR